MIRFETKVFKDSKSVDSWLNQYVQQGLFVRILGYVMDGKFWIVTISVSSREDMRAKEATARGTESQPEEWVEPVLDISSEEEI